MPGGVESYSRLGISPTSNFYAAVELLSREEQGDDVCRGLAFCLYKYFLELPEIVKEKWTENYASQPLPGVPIFGPAHAARLASRMTKVEAIERCLAGLEAAYAQQSVSWLLMRVVLPIGTVKVLTETQADSVGQDIESERAAAETRYGSLAPFIQALGRSTFVPTSKLRRAPSRPGGVSRSVSFARKQKEKVRREMCELLDTEESYVAKIRHLVEDIVKDIQQKLDSDVLRPIGGRRDMLESLFPPSLYDILQLNSAFLQALRRVVEETENNAIRDIQQSTEDNEDREECGFKPGVDVTGAAELADCLLVWFSEFKAPYQVYFQNKSLFSQSIRSFSASCPPDALNVIRTMGEQKLTSLLIEPVQRLPRYSLYIDSIVKQLPVRHDAIRKLLKARDMIADICADACDASDYNKVPDGLKRFITSWPPECSPRSRLVSAIDVEILDPPFVSQKHLSQRLYGILLMFAECLVILKKIKPTALSARGLVAELEKSPIQADEIPSLDRTADITSFAFLRWARLREVTVTEVNNGGAIRAIYRHPTTDRVSQTYTLLGSYENRAHRLTEDICKAKIECEFPETERENGKWEARTYTADLSILSAICEAGMSNSSFDTVKLRAVELFINPSDDDVQSNRARHQNDIFATLHIRSDDECMLSVFGPSGLYSEGQVSLGDLMPMLSRIGMRPSS